MNQVVLRGETKLTHEFAGTNTGSFSSDTNLTIISRRVCAVCGLILYLVGTICMKGKVMVVLLL